MMYSSGDNTPAVSAQRELHKYTSRSRAAVRFVLQRGIFRGVVNFALATKVSVHPAVQELDGAFVLLTN